MKARRQLVEDGPERVLQSSCEVDEAIDRFPAIQQFLHVGDEAVRLDRVPEPRRSLLPPALEGGGKRHPVKARVDFDRVEFVAVTFEPTLLRKAFRIEQAAPVL